MWYRMQAPADGVAVADIYIVDFIGDWIDHYWGFGVTAKAFIDEISKIPESVKTLRLHVNSPGGDAYAAAQIANVLRDQQLSKGRTVEVLIEGLAASAATIITSAGTKGQVRIADNALMMVHNPWTITAGNALWLRKAASDLDKVRNTIITAYRWRSELSEEELGELMDATTVMEADDAILWGFADEKIQGLQVAASFDPRGLALLRDVPEKVRNRIQAMKPRAQEEEKDWRVGGDRDLPVDDEREWDVDAADERVRKWASDGSGEKEQMDWPQYRKGHVVYDANNDEGFEGYKLLFADVVDGRLTAIRAGLIAVRVVLQGGRGGVDLPDEVIERAKAFVDSYLGEQEDETENEGQAHAAAPVDILAAIDAAGLGVAFARELIDTALPMPVIQARIATAVQQRAQAQAREREVRALCALAKCPELADGYIKGGMSVGEIKQQLTAITARLDRAEVDGHLMPDTTQGKARINVRAIYAARNRLTTTTPKEG